MKKCYECGNESLKNGTIEEPFKVGSLEFVVPTSAIVCQQCGENYVENDDLSLAERQIAVWLALHGASDAASFRFMRKVIGFRATDLASLFGVDDRTVSRWENEAPETRAIALLGALVLDAVNGSTTTQDRLRALQTTLLPTGPVHIKAA